MKPKIVALLLLALLIALVGVIPAVTAQGVAGDHPPTPAAPAPAAPPRPYQGQPGPIPSAPDAFTVSGKVTDVHGDPVADVFIQASNIETWDYYETTTNTSGDYSFSFPAGNYEIYPYKDSWRFKPEWIEVTVGPNKSNRDFQAVDTRWQSASYSAIEDAYTNQASKNTNYGSASILRVKNAASDMNTYVKFDVNGLSQETEPGTCFVLGDGWLRAFVTEPGPDGGGVYRVDNNWSENSLNWNNAPTIAGNSIGQFGAVTDETSERAYISQPVNGNGVYSFAIRNNSSNSVDYRSRESGLYPWLVVYYRIEYEDFLLADFWWNEGTGLAPLTVEFTQGPYGCPTSWYWDFGDGTTSMEPNPSHTYTSPGFYQASLTVSSAGGNEDTMRTDIQVFAPPTQFFISPSGNATIGGIPAQGADVLLYDKPSNTWTMVYDGSAHNTLGNISAVDLSGTDLLLTFSANQSIPGLGIATPYDVVRFIPDDPDTYPLGSGTYLWQFQARPYGLTTASEKIDAFDYQTGYPLFSATGAVVLPTDPILKLADEDLFQWNIWSQNWDSWAYLDGSTITGLASEDINGVALDPRTGDLYITILGPFNLGGVAGNGKSIVRLPFANHTPSLVPWLAPGATLPTDIDAIAGVWVE
jgi:PKD repeat protein